MSVYRLRRWPTPSQLRLDEMCLLSRKRQIIQYVRRIIRERGFIDSRHNMVVYQVILKGLKQKQIKFIFKIILYCSCFTDYHTLSNRCDVYTPSFQSVLAIKALKYSRIN